MDGLYYTRQHEWVRFFGRMAFVGVTGKSLQGDVVYIELPEVGKDVAKGELCAKVESVKAVTSVCSPAAGMISAVNDTVFDDPDMIAQSPLSTWLFKLECRCDEDLGLLSEKEYNEI